MEMQGVRKVDLDHGSASEIALEPQIGPPDAIIAEELLARACDRDPAILEHVGVTGEFKRYCDILFDEHAGEPATIEIAYTSQDVLHDGWRKTKRRLVEQDQLGFAHQASADGKHLLLATRECTCGLMAALCQYWKHRIDFRKILFAQAAGTRKHGAHREIFGHRQRGKHLAALCHLTDAEITDFMTGPTGNFDAAIQDAAVRRTLHSRNCSNK